MSPAMNKQKKHILQTINRFGFLSVNEVALLHGSSLRQSYRYLKDLNELGLTNQQRMMVCYSNLHWLTPQGAELCDTPLPIIKRPSIFTLEHDIKVIRLYAYLKKQTQAQNQDSKFNWYTPRELASKNIQETLHLKVNFQKVTRDLPDAIIINGNLNIAIELEKSYKLAQKWERKITNYKTLLSQNILQRVLYYIEDQAVGKALYKIIEKIAPESEIKIIKWKDELKSLY